jgi:hypothetical protein
MNDYDKAEILRLIIRNEMAECERSIRDRDPVRALNALADAVHKMKSLANMLDSKSDAEA